MMKNTIKKVLMLPVLFLSLPALAVHVNPSGTGEVLLIPYYTVNNGLNTLVTVTSTRPETKALKVTFRESHNGQAVMSYNVYLSAFDAWAFALVPNPSNLVGHESETSVLHLTADNSCVSGLDASGEQFSDAELVDGHDELYRLREGYIEIIEMGVLNDNPVAWADPGINANRSGCENFVAGWEAGGIWDESNGGDSSRFLAAGTGGLMAETHLIDVAQGINYAYPAVALGGFWAAGENRHVAPGDSGLSLDAAAPVAWVMGQDQVHVMNMASGIDAVSAVLMADGVMSHYALDRLVGGQAEMVFTFPTRRYYLSEDPNIASPPFAADRLRQECDRFELDTYGGSEIDQQIYDRNSQIDILTVGGIGVPRPPIIPTMLCGAVSVQSFYLPGAEEDVTPIITGAHNYLRTAVTTSASTDSGWVMTRFLSQPLSGQEEGTEQNLAIHGLPVLGLSLSRSTNANSQPGLLAQYGGAVTSTYRVTVETVD